MKSTQETTFVRLSFSVVDGRKTGTDGWYDLVRLQKDPQIYNNKNSDSNTIIYRKWDMLYYENIAKQK